MLDIILGCGLLLCGVGAGVALRWMKQEAKAAETSRIAARERFNASHKESGRYV